MNDLYEILLIEIEPLCMLRCSQRIQQLQPTGTKKRMESMPVFYVKSSDRTLLDNNEKIVMAFCLLLGRGRVGWMRLLCPV